MPQNRAGNLPIMYGKMTYVGGTADMEGSPRRAPMPQETRDKIRASMVGRKHSEETRRRISARMTEVMRDPEVRAKIGRGNRGRPMPTQTKLALRRAHLGRKRPFAVRAKIRTSMLARRYGGSVTPSPRVSKRRLYDELRSSPDPVEQALNEHADAHNQWGRPTSGDPSGDKK